MDEKYEAMRSDYQALPEYGQLPEGMRRRLDALYEDCVELDIADEAKKHHDHTPARIGMRGVLHELWRLKAG